MKITLLLIVALSCLVLSAVASPIQIVEAPKDVATTKDIPVGRQQQGAAGVEEDDDDDDDDDDIDDVLDDDDDDDDDDSPSGAADDDDDDDDDDDYLERFFDDILGEEDDDDDDDDVSPSTGVQQAQQQATQAVAQQAAQDNLSESVDYTVDSTGDVEDGLAPINDEINIQALDQSAKDPISQVAVQPLDDDDDDDDDEEDEIEDALDVTDDDDDDDDDDDLIGDDVIEARNGEEKRSRALKEAEATPVPEIVIQKYNQFVDRIYERINKVLRKSYDPVTVHLTTSTDNKLTANKTKKTNKNKKRNNNNNKLSSRIGTDQLSSAQNNATASAKPVARKRRDVPAAVASKDTKTDSVGIPDTFVTKSATEESAAAQKRANVKPNANKIVKKEAAPVAAASKQADNRGRGTLYGLSSMRRSGDVRVNAMADFTTVKSNFILGPLILKVEKQFGKSGRRELRVATARTQEMLGRINLRIVNGSAVLHSIKVQQPKQVSIQSKDNHDKTREYLWKRSSHIAHLVSEKLSTAARAMLKPQTKRAASQT